MDCRRAGRAAVRSRCVRPSDNVVAETALNQLTEDDDRRAGGDDDDDVSPVVSTAQVSINVPHTIAYKGHFGDDFTGHVTQPTAS